MTEEEQRVYDVAVHLVFKSLKDGRANDVEDMLYYYELPPNLKDEDGNTLLMKAAEHGEDRLVGKLVDAGAEVNAVNGLGETALMIALREQYESCAGVLLKCGALAHFVSLDGDTALRFAIDCDASDHIPAIIRVGGNITDRAEDGSSLLSRAIHWEDAGAVKALLDAGADINECDADGCSLLIQALEAHHNGKEIAMLLLDRKVSVFGTSTSGKTVMRMCVDMEDEDLIRRCVERGAPATEVDADGKTLADLILNTIKLPPGLKGDLAEILRQAAESQRQKILTSGVPVRAAFEGLGQISAPKQDDKTSKNIRRSLKP